MTLFDRARDLYGMAASRVRGLYNRAAGIGASAVGGYTYGMQSLLDILPYRIASGFKSGRLHGFFGAIGGTGRGLASGIGQVYWDNFRRMDGLPSRLGYGAAVASPLLAGAAVYSGLANLRQGRYLRSALLLAAGAGLVGLMYAGAQPYLREARAQRMWSEYENFRMQADHEL